LTATVLPFQSTDNKKSGLFGIDFFNDDM
jgi:hypothetical protein